VLESNSGELQPPVPRESAAARRIPIRASAKDEPRPVLDRQDPSEASWRGDDDQRAAAAETSQPARPATAPEVSPVEIAGRARPLSGRPLAPRVVARAIRDRPAGPRTSSFEAPAPADVHIHIGRVELTAVAPAAPGRREPATGAKKPMSLDDYLRQRSRRP
jgi:hypothetical protein